MGLQCFCTGFDTESYSKAKGISIEMAARELRYDFFERTCREQGFDAVAVAHNANDNAETLILNLLRGTGSRGVRGMSSSPTLLRPMLGTEREQIREWMLGNGLSWREDSTNADSRYKRNLIRNEIFPLFGRINPSFIRTLGEDMERLALVDDIAEDYFLQNKGRLASISSDGAAQIDSKLLLATKHWKYLLFRLLEGSGINADQFSGLVNALEAHLRNPGGTISGKTFGPVTVGAGKIFIGRTASSQYRTEFLKPEQIASYRQEAGQLIMDADQLDGEPRIREWRRGDWMQPLGMKGKKKLSDIFTDLKWPVNRRAQAKVVELDGSHVAALLCERIDEKMRVTEATRRIVRISEIKNQ